jgi:response regulator RpfG family c-di-GMP phosphodiesterase
MASGLDRGRCWAGVSNREGHPKSLGELSVLLIDDDSMTRQTLREIICHLGMTRVLEASDGEEALGLMRMQDVDVVLTDVHMPRMDGLSFLREVKRRWPAVPVVVLTGFPTIETAIQAMKEGASDFIMKPFRIEQIELFLQRALRDRRLLLENSMLSQELQHKREIERLNRDLNRKVKELSVLYAISESLQPSHVEGDALFDKIVRMAAQIVEAKRASLMLVDDETNCLVIKAAVGLDEDVQRQTIVRIGDGIAGKVALDGAPLLIKDIKESEFREMALMGRYRTHSLISVPLLMRGEVFGVLNVADKGSGRSFLEEDLTLLSALAHKAALAIENQALYESIFTTLTDTLLSLVSTIEARDPHTKDHSQRVTQWAVRIAELMGISQEELDAIKFAGYLHDIGKIGVRDSILMKPTALTPEEEAIIRTHPIIGERIVKPLGLLPLERSVIRHHHERWDGRGYPDGLKAEEIPLPARILAVADAYDAITSDRVYRKARRSAEALREIERCTGSQFDRRVVLAFRDVILRQRDSSRRNSPIGGGPPLKGCDVPVMAPREAPEGVKAFV